MPNNLTSAYRVSLAEVKLARTNAGELQRRALIGEMPELTRLPLLGDSAISPVIKGWSESVWTARLSKLTVGFDNVDLVYAMGAEADEILEAINLGTDDVVILDTIRLLRIRDENDNSAINIALTPFIALCRRKGATLLMSHHTRKGSGEHGEAAAGGHAFLGIVDVSLEIHRWNEEEDALQDIQSSR